MKRKVATRFIRVFPSDYKKLRVLSFKLHLSFPEVIEEMLRASEEEARKK